MDSQGLSNFCCKISCFFCPLSDEDNCHELFHELLPEEQREILEEMAEMNNILNKRKEEK